MAERHVAPSQECFHIRHTRRSILIFPHLKTQHVLCFVSSLCLPSQGHQATRARKEDQQRGTLPPLILPNVLSCGGLFTNKSVHARTLKKKMGQCIRLQTKIPRKAWSLSYLGHWSVLHPRHDQQSFNHNSDFHELSCWWHKNFLLRGRHLRKRKIRLYNSIVILQGDLTDCQSTETKRQSQAGHGSGPAGRGLQLAGAVATWGHVLSHHIHNVTQKRQRLWREHQGLGPASLQLCLKTAKQVINFSQGW